MMDSTATRPKRRIRWVIFLFLFAFTFLAYVQRTTISVASASMMPELGLSQVQIGWLDTAFLVSYTALQVPGGVVGEWFGARAMFAVTGAVSVLATLAIPVLPAVLGGSPLFAGLLLAQFVLGVAQAPLFGLLTGVLEKWFPPAQWPLTQGLSAGGVGAGAAAAPAVIAGLMFFLGWRLALVLAGLPMIALAVLWWRHGGNTPREHFAVTPAELAELPEGDRNAAGFPGWSRIFGLLGDRNLAGITLSYFVMNLVFYLITFWSFLYLVQARHFTVLAGGLLAAAPPLCGAAGAAFGGVSGSALTVKFGASRGLRIIPLLSLPASGALLLVSVHAESAMVALAGLSLAFGLLEMNEGCFWAAAMAIGRDDAVEAGAILNTGGNLGGIVATPLVAFLSGGGDWKTPFVAGAGCAVLSAAIWLVIDPGAPCAIETPSASLAANGLDDA